MKTFFVELRATLVPGADALQGPLPPLLVIMTMVAGLVDSFSFLKLGHVFVANATGNILFMGFALAHAPGFSLVESLLALAAFIVGAALCGKIISTFGVNRARVFTIATSLQSVLLLGAVVFSIFASVPVVGGSRDALVAVLGAAMGIQNATARSMAVPGLTTTVLTLTITGIGADSTLVGGSGSKAGPRLISVAVMLIGAAVGALLVLHTPIYWSLILALVLVAFCAGWAELSGRSKGQWTQA
jgi:uncharacterized membrane protein YoaK (UPF0700 family)